MALIMGDPWFHDVSIVTESVSNTDPWFHCFEAKVKFFIASRNAALLRIVFTEWSQWPEFLLGIADLQVWHRSSTEDFCAHHTVEGHIGRLVWEERLLRVAFRHFLARARESLAHRWKLLLYFRDDPTRHNVDGWRQLVRMVGCSGRPSKDAVGWYRRIREKDCCEK